MTELPQQPHRPGNLSKPVFGLRARLLLAFTGIAGFAALTAAAGIYAFQVVGERLYTIDARMTPAVLALDVSRSAERIVAAAPSLLAAANREQQAAVAAIVDGQLADLRSLLGAIRNVVPEGGVLEDLADELAEALGQLESNVAGRLTLSEKLEAARHDIFASASELERLLAPWQSVTDVETDIVLDSAGIGESATDALRTLIAVQRSTRAAEQLGSDLVDMLIEGSTASDPRRLSVLAFQTKTALGEARHIAAQLSDQLMPLFEEQIDSLRPHVEGRDAIVELRREEIAHLDSGRASVDLAARLSDTLSSAVEKIATEAQQDVGNAVGNALDVQRTSGQLLIGLVVLSLISAALIVWLYVGRNVVGRLTNLSHMILSIAEGKLDKPVTVPGADEISMMGEAAEVLRNYSRERNALLGERAQAAERLEQQVRERTAELQHANAFKSRFLAAASHDLRQPLHALNLFIAQLRRERNPAERRRLEQRLEASVASMNGLLEDLLDMSKLEAGIIEPNVTAFALASLLDNLSATLGNVPGERGIRLRIVPSTLWVRSDFILLERVLLNLAANALWHTGRGGVVIGCRRKGARVRLDVVDCGPGIPEDSQAEVFGEFVQLDTTAGSTRRGGLGLGLAIVKRLADLLGHEVELSSKVGAGSRFSIFVPSAPAESSGARSAPELLSGPVDPLTGKVVMVVDDNPMASESLAGLLESWGCRTVTSTGTQSALDALKHLQSSPDAIIADYRLSDGQTGIGAIKRLRERSGRDIPAFLISGETMPTQLRDLDASGLRLLGKPVTPMALRAILTHILDVPGFVRSDEHNGA